MEEKKLLRRRKKAQQDNNEALLISTCTDLANLYTEEGRYNFAIDEYVVIANIYKKQNKQLEYAIANRGIGEAYLGLQKFDKSLHHQKIYLDIVRELKNKLEEQRALATIGHTYLSMYLDASEPDRNNLELANKFLKKSLLVSQSLNGQINKVEIADMSARLLANLGLVQDCLGNFDHALELINKSINLCKSHDLYEQLQRGYMSLASLLVKKGDPKSALQQYNLAAEAAKKIRNKPVLLAGILLSKSEILVQLGDLQGAKNSLKKAYKLKIPDHKERKTIENNLRVVASMSYNEDKLLSTDSTDYIQLKTLYEKMGDGACELKQFHKALEYYKKMLDSAIKADLTGPDLASCYYSLAETYKDNGQFQEAVFYFEQELELCRSLKDSLNTLSKIADTKETADAPISEVQAVYNRAIELCQKEDNIHEEGRMLKRFITYLRRQKQHSEAFQLEQSLAKLNYRSSDSEGESSETPSGSVIGADIDLDDITDVSDDSDFEQQEQKPQRRNKRYQVRRNLKGETPLHVACIKGQLNVVAHLLEQNHPVDERDYCGWHPLHEACNGGYLKIVKLLVEKGAHINDRGGPQCEGITPLHDAATNGHLDVVQFLLDKGANAVAKTDGGLTVLDCLKQWRCTTQLNEDNERLYQSLVDKLKQALDKTGHVKEREDVVTMPSETTSGRAATSGRNMRRSTVVDLGEDNSMSPPQTKTARVTTPKKSMRRSMTAGLEDDESTSPLQMSSSGYRDVMENLRHRNNTQKGPSQSMSMTKRSALVSAEDQVDDWLEDDIGKSFKKRKTNSPKTRKSNSPRFSHKISENVGLDDEMVIDDELTYYQPKTSPAKTSPKRFVRKKQAKLTSLGHTRTFVEADSTSSPGTSRNREPSPKKKFPRTQSFEAQQIIEPTLFVDVRINKKLYRVPILLSQVSTHSIKWLADEASARYARKEYMIPILELETKNGAILADDDPISLLFPMGATQAEEVEARIVKWNVPPLIDRYREACQDMTVGPQDVICQLLQEFSVNLNLSNRGLKGDSLSPLCKVLSGQRNLLEFDLSGNFLTRECLKLLAGSLATMENLSRLSLSCTGLQTAHIQTFVSSLSSEASYKITDLDLSDNFIGDQNIEDLRKLLECFHLKKLNLSGNKFKCVNENSTLNLSQVEEFDISNNDLSNDSLVKILSWLNFPILKCLDVSRNLITDGFVHRVLNNQTRIPNLRICNLSRCHVQDSDIFDLLRISESALETLDVSYNSALTSDSLRRLLESDIQNLSLLACDNIFKYFSELVKHLNESSRHDCKRRTLKISLPENCESEKEFLVNLWKKTHGDRTVVEVTSNVLYLSSK